MEARAITGAEFEHALEKAEHLLAAVDRNAARARAASAWLAVAVVALVVPVFPLLSMGTGYGYVGVVVAGAALAFVLFSGHVAKLRTEERRDERAMFEVVDILRELLSDVAEKERWGPARYKITMARVSRFPVGRRGSR
jgi:hypothetical protein